MSADPTEAGLRYLKEHRPGWSYLPIISWIWTRGFAMGCAVADEIVRVETERRRK